MDTDDFVGFKAIYVMGGAEIWMNLSAFRRLLLIHSVNLTFSFFGNYLAISTFSFFLMIKISSLRRRFVKSSLLCF